MKQTFELYWRPRPGSARVFPCASDGMCSRSVGGIYVNLGLLRVGRPCYVVFFSRFSSEVSVHRIKNVRERRDAEVSPIKDALAPSGLDIC